MEVLGLPFGTFMRRADDPVSLVLVVMTIEALRSSVVSVEWIGVMVVVVRLDYELAEFLAVELLAMVRTASAKSWKAQGSFWWI